MIKYSIIWIICLIVCHSDFVQGYSSLLCYNHTYTPCIKQVCIYGRMENVTRCDTRCVNGEWIPSRKPYGRYPLCCPICHSKRGWDLPSKKIYKTETVKYITGNKNASNYSTVPRDYPTVRKIVSTGYVLQHNNTHAHPPKHKASTAFKSIKHVRSNSGSLQFNYCIVTFLLFLLYRYSC